MPRKLLTISCLVAGLGICATLFAQGLTTTATKDDWEEINFEFNSAVLSDGYPSLLRLAELLSQHSDYKVKVEGNTDYVGSEAYNDKLALARAETVKSFLTKYGAKEGQIEATGRGKRNPAVDNRTSEGRFMNRRVTLTVTDGQGRTISAGGVGDAVKAIAAAPDCCQDVLKKADKDEILGALRGLSEQNGQLKQDVSGLKQDSAALKAAQAGIQQQVGQLPKPPERAELAQMMEETAQRALAQARPKRFQLLDLNLGPDRTGNLSVSGRARFFAPFGEGHALQAQGEYLRYADRQEGQFDVGLLDRRGSFQAGLFSSFKRVQLKDYAAGGTLGQAAGSLDYVFSRGRIGAFGTKSFLDEPVIRRVGLGRSLVEETYLRVVDQVGGSTQIGLYKNTYVEGNLGVLFRRGGSNRPGGTVRLVQPLNSHWAFTVEGGLNETLIGQNDSGRVVFGLQLGNWIRPKEFAGLKSPVPMDVPRIRYEMLTRTVRIGNQPPVADAGPDRVNVAAGVIQLDGSGSYDPDGDAITYQWSQISGPVVPITGATTAKPTFTAAASQTYVFRLVVTDDQGAFGQARVTIGTAAAQQLKIIRFTAQPPQIDPGGSTTLVWEVRDADEVTISGIGQVNAKAGTSTVTLSQTTTYTLTAKNSVEEASETITVTVNRPQVRIVSFLATPASIDSGGATTLSWQTENATEAAIGGIGSVSINGVTAVSPTATTTYTLTAKNQFGEVSATVTVTVTAVVIPPSNRAPVADAGPNQTSMRFPMQLNGSASYDPDGDPITFSWRVSGAKPASIVGANTATPSVTPQQGYGDYIFELTVTDDKGARSTATTTVNYIDP